LEEAAFLPLFEEVAFLPLLEEAGLFFAGVFFYDLD